MRHNWEDWFYNVSISFAGEFFAFIFSFFFILAFKKPIMRLIKFIIDEISKRVYKIKKD